MDKLPFEIFACIIQLLDHENRLNCCQVCKSWNSNIQRSYLLLETIVCSDLTRYDRIKHYFKQNQHFSAKTSTFEYNLAGELPVENLKQLPPLFPGIMHLQIFTNDSVMYTYLNSKGRKIAPRNVRVMHEREPRRGVYEGGLNEQFVGWSKTLERIEETSTNMLSAFMLNCTIHPFERLAHLWLNFSNISLTKVQSGMDYLVMGLKQAPVLEEITICNTNVNLSQLDILHEQCQHLKTLRLESVVVANHPEEPGQRFMYDVPPLHYNPLEAPSVKSIEIITSTFYQGTPICSYMAKKYTQAEKIICNISKLGYCAGTSEAHRNQATELIHACTLLKCFESNLFDLTPEFLLLMDRHGVNNIQQFTLGIDDGDVNNLQVLCTTKSYSTALKDLKLVLNFYPTQFNDILLNLKNLTRLDILNFDCPSDTDDHDFSSPVMIPFGILLNGLEHLQDLSLNGFIILMDRIEEKQHGIKQMSLKLCTFESFEADDGTLFSPFNYISKCCQQLQQLLLIDGYWNYAFAASEVTLTLFDHKELRNVQAIVQYNQFPYLRHLDEEEVESWFEIQQDNQNEGIECYPMNQEPPPSVRENNQYFTIACADTSLFYTPKVYYQEPYLF